MSERAIVWNVREHRARKQHTCVGCREPVCVGTVYHEIRSLVEDSWRTSRIHLECHELAIRLSRWPDGTYYDDGVYFVEDLFGQVADRWREDKALLLAWRDLRRARLREQRGRTNLCDQAPADRAEENYTSSPLCAQDCSGLGRFGERVWAECVATSGRATT